MALLANALNKRIRESENDEQPNWTELVEKIQQDNQSALEELYRIFSRGMRYYLCRQLGPQDLDDRVHDSFLIVVQAFAADLQLDLRSRLGLVGQDLLRRRG